MYIISTRRNEKMETQTSLFARIHKKKKKKEEAKKAFFCFFLFKSNKTVYIYNSIKGSRRKSHHFAPSAKIV
jgi:hypothetical protein